MIRNTLSYKFGILMGMIALLLITGIPLFFKFLYPIIDPYGSTVWIIYAFILNPIIICIKLISTLLAGILIAVDIIIFKKYAPPKKASTVRIVFECALITLYLFCFVAPICSKLIQHIFGG